MLGPGHGSGAASEPEFGQCVIRHTGSCGLGFGKSFGRWQARMPHMPPGLLKLPDREFPAGQRVPDLLLEVHWEPILWRVRLADLHEAASTVVGAGTIQVVVPVALFPSLDHPADVAVDLSVPEVNFVVSTVGWNLDGIVFCLQD